MAIATSPGAYDVIVIGAGIVGACTAYYSARYGADRILMLEEGQPGRAMTIQAAGGIRQTFTNEGQIELSRRGIRFWRHDMEVEFGAPGTYARDGYLLLAADEKMAGELASGAELQRRMGMPEVKLLDPRELERHFPWLGGDGLLVACWTPDDGRVDTLRGTQAVVQRAIELGVELKTGCRVASFERDGGRWRVHTAAGDVFTTEKLVLAAGLGCVPLARQIGLELPFQIRHRIFGVLPALPSGAVPPHTIDLETGQSVFGHGDHVRISVGGVPGPVDAADMMQRFRALAPRRVPGLKDVEPTAFAEADLSMTNDGLPYVGRIGDGLWLSLFMGTGIMHGPPVAEMLAREICGKAGSEVDISAWSPTRDASDVNSVWWYRTKPGQEAGVSVNGAG